MNYNSLSYNKSLLTLHEYHLYDKSLYELYILRKNIIDNKNYIVERLICSIIKLIDSVIINKENGSLMLKLLNDNDILCKEIFIERNIKVTDNLKLLKLFKNINKLEEIFNFNKDALLNSYQKKLRLTLKCKYYMYKVKNCLLCII